MIQSAKAHPGDRPMNVLLLVADDLNSWLLDDPNRYPGKVIAPNLRKLARSGVNFTRAYTAAPVCSPSRTAFFSGVAPWRSGHYHNTPGANTSEPLSNALSMVGAIRNEADRYTRYQDGEDEFYDTASDPHEWTNQIANPGFATTIQQLRSAAPQVSSMATPLPNRVTTTNRRGKGTTTKDPE